MRVTHVITRLIVGGAQENTVSSVIGLARKQRLEVDLVSGPGSGREGSMESSFTNSPGMLSIEPALVRPIHPWKDLLALNRLEKRFQRTRPHIVHTHSGKAGVIGRLAAARARVPVIVHTIHGPSFGDFQGPLANWLFRTAELKAEKVTHHFVTVADAMREQYLAAGIGRREQYSTVFSGFDLDPFLTARNDPTLRAKLGIDPDDLVVGKIARLFALKGHDDLIEVAAELVRVHPRVKFLLVGDGSWRSRLEEKARQMGVRKSFVFAGLVPPREVACYVGIMDVLVHLSLREGLPRALPQALAAGRPVVAYDCDGAREACLDGQTGFLVKPRDLTGVNRALKRLLEDESLRRRLGGAGQSFVRERFPVERMVDDLYALYMELSAANSGGRA